MTDKPQKPRRGKPSSDKHRPARPGNKSGSAKKGGADKSVRPPEARALALAMLGRIIHQRQTLDEALNDAFGPGKPGAVLEARDRGFARLLVTAVLRRRGQIDDILSHCLSKPLEDTQPRLLNILRLGAVQILFLETAPHAAVDATVRLAGKHASQRGLINAILRRLDREGRDWVSEQEKAGVTGRLNTPEWLWQSWSDAWGEKATDRIAACHAEEPALDLTLQPDSNAAELAEELSAVVMQNGSLRRAGGGRIEDLPGYAEGKWWVQDVSATLPATLLLSSLDANELSGPVIDLCAAPGGKTAQLAASGASVTAVDMSGKRLQRVTENLTRLNLEAEVIKADIRKWQPDHKAAGVLLDAPCSATGTIRRHPDAAWSKSPSEVKRLVKIQQELIRSAADMLMPGGVLVYCTCSLQPEEGEAQAERMRHRDDLIHLPFKSDELTGFGSSVTAEGDIRILPGQVVVPDGGEEPVAGGNDGFFITRFKRAE